MEVTLKDSFKPSTHPSIHQDHVSAGVLSLLPSGEGRSYNSGQDTSSLQDRTELHNLLHAHRHTRASEPAGLLTVGGRSQSTWREELDQQPSWRTQALSSNPQQASKQENPSFLHLFFLTV